MDRSFLMTSFAGVSRTSYQASSTQSRQVHCWPEIPGRVEAQSYISDEPTINGQLNIQMEPTRLIVCAMMTAKRAAHLTR
jgi:hypothetical protein